MFRDGLCFEDALNWRHKVAQLENSPLNVVLFLAVHVMLVGEIHYTYAH